MATMMSGRKSAMRDVRDLSELEGGSKSFLGHLEDLRTTLVWVVGLLFAGILVAIPLAPVVSSILMDPVVSSSLGERISLELFGPDEAFSLALKLICWSGVLFSTPFVLLAIAWFVFPGLTRREKRAVVIGSGFSVVLFVLGVWLGYSLTLQVALGFSLRVVDWMGFSSDLWRAPQYIGFVLKLLLAFGLAFQLPVVLLAAGYAGLVGSRVLREKRRHVIVGLLILAMLLTPSDPVTMLLMGVPLIFLYELCIWVIWLRERGGASPDGACGASPDGTCGASPDGTCGASPDGTCGAS
jgi:sec-independent protein translocase protein TatC